MVCIVDSDDVGRHFPVRDDALIELAEQRLGQGLAPPPEVYRVEYRNRIDWLQFPDWARPVDPQLFDGCCHEG